MDQRINHLHEALQKEGVNHLITVHGEKILIIMGFFICGHVRTESDEDSEYETVNIWERVYPDIRSIQKRQYFGGSVEFRGIRGEKIL
jgi:hypothetical protein